MFDKLVDHKKIKEKNLKYDSEFFKVIEIPMAVGVNDAWEQIEYFIRQGFTIKGVVERETWKTSYVLLEKIRELKT